MEKDLLKTYSPLLKWHRGESQALQNLAGHISDGIRPIIELELPRTDLNTGLAIRSDADQIKIGIERVQTSWGARRFYLDPIKYADKLVNGMAASRFAFETAGASRLEFVPTLHSATGADERAAAYDHATHGLALRLFAEDFEPTPQSVNQKIDQALADCPLPRGDIDLVIDLESVAGQPQVTIQSTTVAVMAALQRPGEWRTVALLASAFPATISSVVPASSVNYIERAESQAWHSLYVAHASPTPSPLIARFPNFGDYGIQSPTEFFDFDPRYMKNSAQVRYTSIDKWYVGRGLAIQTHGGAQFTDLAVALVASGDFMGAQHCWACASIEKCANGEPGFNSAEKWRMLGTCHHLTVTVEQLRSLP